MKASKNLLALFAIVGGIFVGLFVIVGVTGWNGAKKIERWSTREPDCDGRRYMTHPELGFAPRGRTAQGKDDGAAFLFVGDRLLWGECGPGNESVPNRVVASLGGHGIADVPMVLSLAQLQITALEALGRAKPDYAIVQYSSSLVERSLHPYLDTPIGHAAVPYYIDAPDGKVTLAPPRFASALAANVFGAIFFDGVHHALSVVRGAPKPTKNRLATVRYAYDAIARVARERGIRLFFVLLGRLDENDLRAVFDVMPASVVSTGEPIEQAVRASRDPALATELAAWREYPELYSATPFPRRVHAMIAASLEKSIAQVKESFEAPFR